MSNILSDLANSVGSAVSNFFKPSPSFLPTSKINSAFNSAYASNPRYSLQPGGGYAENQYGKTMDQLDKEQQQMQPAINNTNYISALVDLGYQSTHSPGSAFPYGNALTAPPDTTHTNPGSLPNYAVPGNPNPQSQAQPVDNSQQDLSAFGNFWNAFQDSNPSDYLYPKVSTPDTSAFTNAANQIGQPTQADSWLKGYL